MVPPKGMPRMEGPQTADRMRFDGQPPHDKNRFRFEEHRPQGPRYDTAIRPQCDGLPRGSGPTRFDGLPHRYDGRNNGQRFDGGPRDDCVRMNGPRFDGGPKMDHCRFDNPRMDNMRFSGPRMDGPRFDGPRMEGNDLGPCHWNSGPRFDRPPRMNGQPVFDGPPRMPFDGPCVNGPPTTPDGPPRMNGPSFAGPGFSSFVGPFNGNRPGFEVK
ncbi:pre-mRNA cleavage complex 2 protein Pcf11-like [Lingula anatina]|uniref:Pre-mRNA cleavage complex 2 protein Pcf11-like n=1 Tax=Lingula anatina TaxID=7574 RepID=A0A2R2MNL9_LINAN|nr:pre-mRNA cleavage complex 2 protein Pcf11-like [Lingula anatina]|eukprot:XP_023931642.1 pre-mRNA cleavage complex 2 protein Pcf11-like [Lingula anatina]